MISTLRDAIRKALDRREDAAVLTSQGVQSVPAPLVLADLVVRECVLAVSRGLDGWAPAETLPERVQFYVGTIRSASVCVDENSFFEALQRVWVSADGPGFEGWDEIGLPIVCDRPLTLGSLGVGAARSLAEHITSLSELKVTMALLDEESGEPVLPVVGEMAALDGPDIDGHSTWGLAGAPIRIRVLAGKDGPELHLLVDVPLGRLPNGVLEARGVLVEDVRGAEHFRNVAMTLPYVLGASLALSRLDDDAQREGGPAIGFAGRVSAIYDQKPLGPVELLDEVTEVLPHLARQLRDRQEVGDEFSALVLNRGISDLVGRTKTDPASGSEFARGMLARGLAPHVRPEGVYWLPIGEYVDVFPPESFDRAIAEGLNA